MRVEELLIDPKAEIGIGGKSENSGFRLFSQMLESFYPFQTIAAIDSEIGKGHYLPNLSYAAGLFAAMQEADNNPANYGLAKDVGNDYRLMAAKIDSNSDYSPASRGGAHGGIYFNHMKRRQIQEVAGFENRDSVGFSSSVAENLVFNSAQDPNIIRFVGKGALSIKDGCDENFKYFMMGVKDFVAMPNEFIDFICQKTYEDLVDKSQTIADKEKENIDDFRFMILDLQKVVAKYFKGELALFQSKFPDESKKSEELWKELFVEIDRAREGPASPSKTPPQDFAFPGKAPSPVGVSPAKEKKVQFAEV